MNQDNGKFNRRNRSVEHGESHTWLNGADAPSELAWLAKHFLRKDA